MRGLHKEAPVIDISARRFFEETAWRIKAVKLERDRHANQRHLNPLNVGDLFTAMVESMKGRNQDAILVLGERLDAASQETLEVFVESPDAGGSSDSKVKSLFHNLKPSNIKQKLSRDRSIDDSTDVSVIEEPLSDNGSEQDGQLDGQIFTVGVAYAQVLQVDCKGNSITIYYHPNSLRFTQSVRVAEANSWRFTVTLDTPEEAEQVAEDIESQLAKYAQAVSWLRHRYIMDDEAHLITITQGPSQPDLSQALLQESPQRSLGSARQQVLGGHWVLIENPHWETVVDAPQAWCQEGLSAQRLPVVRVYMATPLGTFCADVSKALAEDRLQGRKHTAAFFVRATRALAARQHNYEALEQRKQQLSKFLTSKSKTMQRVSNTGRRGQGDAGSSPGAGRLHLARGSAPQASPSSVQAAHASGTSLAAFQEDEEMEPGPVTQSNTAALRRTESDLPPVATSIPGPGRGQGLEVDGAQSSCTTDDMASTAGIMGYSGGSLDDSPPLQVLLHCRVERHAMQQRPSDDASSTQMGEPEPSGTSGAVSASGIMQQLGTPSQDQLTSAALAAALLMLMFAVVPGGPRPLLQALATVAALTLCTYCIYWQRLLSKQGHGGSMADQPTAATGPARDQGSGRQPPAWRLTLTFVKAEVVAGQAPDAGESFEIDDEASLASVELAGEAAEGGAEASKQAKRESALQRWAREHEVDPETLHRFTFACQGNEKEAKQRLQQRAEWLKKNDFENIISQPQPNFGKVKDAILHGTIGFSKSDHPIRLMRVGDMRAAFKKLKNDGVNAEQALRHFVWLEEYLWSEVDSRALPHGTAFWIVDLGGMSLADLGSEAFQFFKRMSVEVGTYYPERLHRLVLINAPGFFSLLWKICEPVMPVATRSKVIVVSKKELISALADEVDPSQIPTDYGGTMAHSLNQCKLELQIREAAEKLTRHAN